MNLPDYGLHSLKGELLGFYAVTVRANLASYFPGLTRAKLLTLIISITTERTQTYADEKSSPPRQSGAARLH